MTVLFTWWGYDVTAVELASVILAFLAIALGIVGNRWTWPPYFLSSLLYAWLFGQFHLFASAALQSIFMAAAVWGWFSWGREGARIPGRLDTALRIRGVVGVLVAWVLLAPLLHRVGGAATWGDAFVLVGSLAAQALMVLQKVDRAAMFHSLEVRVPLLDLEVLDLAERVDPADCVSGTTGKLPLRGALARRVPPESIPVPKKGFTVPMAALGSVIGRLEPEHLQAMDEAMRGWLGLA
jgi:hypothetical protein